MTATPSTGEQLKPCPFCGGKAEFTEHYMSGEHEIECGTCPFISFWPVDWASEQVFSAWNTRSRIQSLEAALKELTDFADIHAMDKQVKSAIDEEIIGWEKTPRFCALLDEARKILGHQEGV